ncbi:MAG TPA: trimethylamine methyltransferase family protein [Thermoleophilia bacterium]|nr:trimethylamine methyltransferase family protein [Thermoleophilia bacterium]
MTTEKTTQVGRLAFLTDDDKKRIYEAALHILAAIGMRVLHEEGRELLLAGGCTLDSDGLVHVPGEVVARARATAPAAIPVFDRAGEPAFSLEGYETTFGTGSDLMHLYDLETGERRRTTLADVLTCARLCDALDDIDFVMSSAYPHEVQSHRAYLEEFRAMMTGTTKPLVMTAEGRADLECMWAAAGELRGDPDGLRSRPYFIVYDQPSSPLEHPADSVDKLLFCADVGLPAIYSPAPLAGGTAPITVAGHVAQGLAESLLGLVLHQLRTPGAPFITGMGPAVLDMATTQSSYNAPEYLQSYACFVEMAKWLDLPNWGYAGTTDAQLVDAQAGMEVAELTLLSMLLGSNLNHDVGYMDFGMTGSLEQIVITDEFIAMNRRLLGGVEVSDDTLALDVIAAMGPGGDALGQKHTVKHLRSGQWRPRILNRKGHERWVEEGAPDLREAARRRALDLLATHEAPPLDDDVRRRVDRIVEEFRPDA